MLLMHDLPAETYYQLCRFYKDVETYEAFKASFKGTSCEDGWVKIRGVPCNSFNDVSKDWKKL